MLPLCSCISACYGFSVASYPGSHSLESSLGDSTLCPWLSSLPFQTKSEGKSDLPGNGKTAVEPTSRFPRNFDTHFCLDGVEKKDEWKNELQIQIHMGPSPSWSIGKHRATFVFSCPRLIPCWISQLLSECSILGFGVLLKNGLAAFHTISVQFYQIIYYMEFFFVFTFQVFFLLLCSLTIMLS